MLSKYVCVRERERERERERDLCILAISQQKDTTNS